MEEAEFDRLIGLHCRGWAPRSVTTLKEVMVGNRRVPEVAAEHDMLPQQLYVLRTRFQAVRQRVVKIPATEFMSAVLPDRAAVLAPFKVHVRRLLRKGYSSAQIAEYLTKNDLSITAKELADFLEKLK